MVQEETSRDYEKLCRNLNVCSKLHWIVAAAAASQWVAKWICAKFHGNPSNSCRDLSPRTTTSN